MTSASPVTGLRGKGRAAAGGPCAVDPLDDFPPKRSVPYLAVLLSRLVQGDYLARIAGTGIAPAQAFVLRELWREQPLSQVELSRRLDIGKATVGQTLSRLARAGLITRCRLDSDRRVMMIHLTAAGRALRPVLAEAACAQIEELRAALGAADTDRLLELIGRAVDHFRHAPLFDGEAV